MRTIKFISDDPVQKQLSVAIRKNVNEYFRERKLSTKGDWRMFLKAAIMLSLYLTPFVLILTTAMHLWMVIFLVVIMGFGEAGIGMSVMHDATHSAFSDKKWINTLFSSTMFILGSNTFNWKIQHNILHHTFTNIYGFDQDIETKAMLRLSKHAPLKKFHKLQYLYAYFFYGLMTLSKLFTDLNQLLDFNKEGITKEQNHDPKREILKLIVTKIVYFSIVIGLPIWLTSFTWWQVLIGFSILHVTAGMIMSTVFQMAHVVEGTAQPLPDENGVIHNEWIIHQLSTTSDFARNSAFLNWYVGGLNFQIEHHLFPNVCHIHYRNIAPIVESTTKEFGFTYNLKPSFLSAFISHSKRLKELGEHA